jgi:hypothetical protein
MAPFTPNLGTRSRRVVKLTPLTILTPLPHNEPRYAMNKRLGGPQSRSGAFGDESVAPAMVRTPDSPASG